MTIVKFPEKPKISSGCEVSWGLSEDLGDPVVYFSQGDQAIILTPLQALELFSYVPAAIHESLLYSIEHNCLSLPIDSGPTEKGA
jgi:hypothetical protein